MLGVRRPLGLKRNEFTGRSPGGAVIANRTAIDDAGRPDRAWSGSEVIDRRMGLPSPRGSALGATPSGLVALAIAGLASGLPVLAQDTDFAHPKAHFRVEHPADVDDAAAMAAYDEIVDRMVAGYALSRDPSAERYQRWRSYNRAPYLSATHGDRYVNNYVNVVGARDYARFGGIGAMPVGTIVAKDSFAITAAGEVFPGPLFLMEKMPEGFDPTARDWRYTMILPDGSYFGTTNGDGAERVEFCVTCHATAGDENDHLFFVPEEQRLAATKPATE
jgi:hypothetical protein